MKAYRADYAHTMFCFSEPFGDGFRLIVWHEEEGVQKALFFDLLESMGERIEYLFKEEVDAEAEDRWSRICGGLYKDDLKRLIHRFQDWFFSDSAFQFCVREPGVTGYFAYDEHGIFFVYDNDVRDILTGRGFPEEQEERYELLSDKPHWHKSPRNGDERLADFKEALKQASVFFDDEGEEDISDGG